jgi:hypothetical protein
MTQACRMILNIRDVFAPCSELPTDAEESLSFELALLETGQ